MFIYNDNGDVNPRDTSPDQDSTGTAPSGTPPTAQPPPPPQTRGTQSHSAPTPLKQPMLTPGICICICMRTLQSADPFGLVAEQADQKLVIFRLPYVDVYIYICLYTHKGIYI